MMALAPLVLGRTAPFAALGAALGLAHFALLRLNVHLYLRGGSAVSPVALHVTRLACIGTAFLAISPRGPAALLSALAGFSVVRFAVARPHWRPP
jgi:hypothetical protein